jgi:hypothetical protein
MPTYDDATTLRDALRAYFDDNGFGADGGYSSDWVDFKLGPIPFPFPNTQSRKRALVFHDLHHIVTGYATDLRGESEIGAWELGGGCGDHATAWALDLAALGGGLFLAPLRTFRAFVRGRHAETLYRSIYDDALLSKTVGEARRALGLNAEGGTPARPSDVVAFVAHALVGLVAIATFFALATPIVALWSGPALVLAARKQRTGLAPAV